MEPKKLGRGIPKDRYKIARTAWKKSNDDDMKDYGQMEVMARDEDKKLSAVAKELIKQKLDDLENSN